MSSWQFDSHELSIRNLDHGTWAIDLSKVTNQEALLQWLLQAAKHNFNMEELFQEFRRAITYCFNIDGMNGAQMLQDLYKASPAGINAGVKTDWVNGTISKR